MKGKTKQYLLLALVLAIWGVIGYRFMSFTEDGVERIDPIRLKSTNLPKEKSQEYQFKLNYADPFLRNLEVEEEPVLQEEYIPDPVRTSFLRIPEVQLKGIVSSKTTRAALIQVNGHSNHMVTLGQEFEGFKLIDLKENQVKLYFENADSTVVLEVRNYER